MKDRQKPLYDKAQARSLQKREESWEKFWKPEQQEKFGLILQNLGPCRRLVDIGCGWGQFLRMASRQVDEVWGVDESPDRVADMQKVCPTAKVVVCRADQLELPDRYFDVVTTCQMLHEVKLFGRQGELLQTLQQFRRALVDGGRYFLLDHHDGGDGEVTVKLPPEAVQQLIEFEQKYRYYQAVHEDLGDGTIRISKRCLQDFLTKTWSLNTEMESMEMEETHNVFEQKQITGLIEQVGFSVDKWIEFSDIRQDLDKANGQVLTGQGWFRKFLLIATKV